MKSVIWGIIASVALLLLYAAVMTILSRTWIAAIEQFKALWWLMIPLAAGFGIQVGLYVRLSSIMKNKSKGSLAAGGTTASLGMLACCLHHVTEILPFIGLSALSILLIRYQVQVLLGSLLINLAGIYLMLNRLHAITRRIT